MSERHRGSDSGGEYIVWTDAKGQINKKYISGPGKGTHVFYDQNTTHMGASFGSGSQETVKDRRNGEKTDKDGYPN